RNRAAYLGCVGPRVAGFPQLERDASKFPPCYSSMSHRFTFGGASFTNARPKTHQPKRLRLQGRESAALRPRRCSTRTLTAHVSLCPARPKRAHSHAATATRSWVRAAAR